MIDTTSSSAHNRLQLHGKYEELIEDATMRRTQAMLLACGMFCLAGAEPPGTESFEKLIALIKPSAGEDKWANIPWQTSLWEARKIAAREGKPILLWEMDGHPLGCT